MMSAPPQLPPRKPGAIRYTQAGSSNGAPSPQPASFHDPFFLASVERYRAVCQRETELIAKGKSDDAYAVFESFMLEEMKARKVKYGRDEKDEAVKLLGGKESAQSACIPDATSRAEGSTKPNDDSKEQGNAKVDMETIPPSPDVSTVLDKADAIIAPKVPESKQQLLERVKEAISVARALDFVSSDRWAFQSTETEIQSRLENEEQQRHNALDARVRALYDRNAWDEVTSIQEDFEKEQKQIRLQAEKDALQRWKGGYFDPILGKLYGLSAGIWTAYTELLNVDGDEWDEKQRVETLDNALSAAEYLSEEIQRVEEDLSPRTHQILISAFYADNNWDGARAADEAFEEQNKALRTEMESRKHDRFNEHVESIDVICGRAIKRLRDVYDETRREVEKLLDDIEQKTGDPTPATDAANTEPTHTTTAPLMKASPELITQLEKCSSTLRTLQDLIIHHTNCISTAQTSLHRSSHNLSQSTLYAQNNWEKARAASDAFETLQSQTAQKSRDSLETLRTQLALQPLQDRIKPIIQSHYQQRSGATGDFASSYGKLMHQQWQTRMVSNMLHTMHVSNMSVINNIGSSNTRWEYRWR